MVNKQPINAFLNKLSKYFYVWSVFLGEYIWHELFLGWPGLTHLVLSTGFKAGRVCCWRVKHVSRCATFIQGKSMVIIVVFPTILQWRNVHFKTRLHGPMQSSTSWQFRWHIINSMQYSAAYNSLSYFSHATLAGLTTLTPKCPTLCHNFALWRRIYDWLW